MKKSLFVCSIISLITIAACAPKSRYRAKDEVKPTLTTQGKGGGAAGQTSTFPDNFEKDMKKAAAPQGEPSIALAKSIQFIGILESITETGVSLNVYIERKEGESTVRRLVKVEGTKTDLKSKEVIKIVEGKREKEENSPLKISGECSDEDRKCMALHLVIFDDEANVEVSAGFTSVVKKKVSKDESSVELDEKIKDIAQDEILTQSGLVVMTDETSKEIKFRTLAIADSKALILMLKMDSDVNLGVQSQEVIISKIPGVESTNFVLTNDKTKDFTLNLKNKDKVSLGTLKFESLSAPDEPVPAACERKDDATKSIEVKCVPSLDDKDQPIANEFRMIVNLKDDGKRTQNVLRYHEANEAADKNAETLPLNSTLHVLKLTAAKPVVMYFSAKTTLEDGGVTPEVSLTVSKDCCPDTP